MVSCLGRPTKILIEKSLKQTKDEKKRSGRNQNPNQAAASLIYIPNSLPLVSQLDIKLSITQVPSKRHVKAGLVDCNFKTFLTFIHFMSKYLTLIETGI